MKQRFKKGNLVRPIRLFDTPEHKEDTLKRAAVSAGSLDYLRESKGLTYEEARDEAFERLRVKREELIEELGTGIVVSVHKNSYTVCYTVVFPRTTDHWNRTSWLQKDLAPAFD